jgi:glycosyltransferase involved in cell wall biosynthesis
MFNSAKFISEALESVLHQTVPVHEIVCIDDASTDNTVNIVFVHYPQVKLIRNNVNRGAAASRNIGISNATGDAISFLDADDYWIHDKNEWQINVLGAENVDIVVGLGENFYESTEENAPLTPHFNAQVSTMLIRTSVFRTIGNFDESMRLSEDQDWFLRARESGSNIIVHERLVTRFRRHNNNTTKGLNFKNSGMIDVIKKSLDRRRVQGSIEELKIIRPE